MSNRITFQFRDDLGFQMDAINSVVNLFNGVSRQDEGTIYRNISRIRKIGEGDPVRNPQIVKPTRLLWNLRKVQLDNKLLMDNELKDNNFTVEMETGERVIIVTGCINALRSRVSGTLVNMIHALLRVIKYNYCKQCMRSKDVLALQY